VAKYRVKVNASARKELDLLSPNIIQRIFSRLESLATNPRPSGCKKLKGGNNEWRIRVDDYRVVYEIKESEQLVNVTRIRHRKDVYKA
jgi:mRNA interferase RelE/StbE